eukprot:2794780-Rhodomonas_salina.1
MWREREGRRRAEKGTEGKGSKCAWRRARVQTRGSERKAKMRTGGGGGGASAAGQADGGGRRWGRRGSRAELLHMLL